MVSSLVDLCVFSVFKYEQKKELISTLGKSTGDIHCFDDKISLRKLSLKKVCYLSFKNNNIDLIESIVRNKIIEWELIMLWASEFGHFKHVEFAFNNGGRNGKECLYAAADSEFCNEDIIRFLLFRFKIDDALMWKCTFACPDMKISFLILQRIFKYDNNYVEFYLKKSIKQRKNDKIDLLLTVYEPYFDNEIYDLIIYAIKNNNLHFIKEFSEKSIRNEFKLPHNCYLRILHRIAIVQITFNQSYEIIVYLVDNELIDKYILIQSIKSYISNTVNYDERILNYLEIDI